MTSEPLLSEIRRVRHEISAENGHDPRKLVAYYAELQRTLRRRVVNLSGEVVSERDMTGSETLGVTSQSVQ